MMAMDFERAAAVWPLSHEIRMQPAYFYSRWRNDATLAHGSAVIDDALRSNPYAADLWWNLGVIRAQLGDNDGAHRAKTRARQIAPKGRFS